MKGSMGKEIPATIHSIVRVYGCVDGEKTKFLRYETPQGVPCDERGRPLGSVTFRSKGSKS